MTPTKGNTLKCPRCSKFAIELLSLYDDGKGNKYCRSCKREIRRKLPDKDFRKKIDVLK